MPLEMLKLAVEVAGVGVTAAAILLPYFHAVEHRLTRVETLVEQLLRLQGAEPAKQA